MGIADLFKNASRDEVTGTKVLVASLDPKFSVALEGDRNAYEKYYPGTVERSFNSIGALLEAVKGHDVVHLFCDVSAEGNIMGTGRQAITGTALIKTCSKSGAKLVWIASANKPAGYIAGFKAKGAPVNVVMTISRTNFSSFLENLLARMSAGQTMPAAWVALAPQNVHDPRQQGLPECIFSAGRGSVVLR